MTCKVISFGLGLDYDGIEGHMADINKHLQYSKDSGVVLIFIFACSI